MSLQLEIEALETQLKVLKERARIEAEQERLSVPIKIVVTDLKETFNGDIVYVQPTYREDHVKLARQIEGRRWNDIYKREEFPISSFSAYIIAASALPNANVDYSGSVRERIEHILNNNVYAHVDLLGTDKLSIVVKEHRTFYTDNILKPLLTSNLLQTSRPKNASLPIGEGHKLYLATIEDKRFVWSDEAFNLIKDKYLFRLELDKLVLQEDVPEYADIRMYNGIKPRGYQNVGVKFLNYVDGNAIVADGMGLGKSLQAIMYAMLNNYRVLFIVPASAKENWYRYIKAYTGVDPKQFSGTEPDMNDIENLLLPDKRVQYNLMHYDMFSRPIQEKKNGEVIAEHYLWSKYVTASKFDLIVLDECHKIKNMSASRTKAVLALDCKRFVGLSGTPILNRPGEFYPFLHLIKPKEFQNYEDFLRRYTDGKNGVRNAKELRELLRPVMIRRLNSDVNKELPPIVRTEEYIQMTTDERKQYDKIMSGIYQNLYGKEFNVANILAEITRLKQYSARVKAPHTAEFAIECYEEAVEAEETHCKVIIFTQWVETAIQLNTILGNHQTVLVTGLTQPKGRLELVDKFQNDPAMKYLVATTGSASEALNITAAGFVLFNDVGWTPALHQQCEGRVYGRANDLHGCKSFYFLCPNTVEDWIWELLATKMNTIDETVDGVQRDRVEESSIAMAIIQRMGIKR